MATEEEKKKAYEQEKEKAKQIFEAAAHGDIEKLKLCTENFLDGDYDSLLGYKDGNGRTPLHFAAHSGQVGICKLLCERCNIDWLTNKMVDNEGYSPMTLAIRSGHLDVVKLLHDNGVKMDESLITPKILFQAASSGNVDLLRYLMSNGAASHINEGSDAGTALHGATFARSPDCVKLLLDFGAQVDVTDSNGMTSLVVAAGLGATAIVSALLDAGADPLKAMNDGTTALHSAATTGNMETLAALVQNSSKHSKLKELLEAKNGHSQTAVEVALESKHLEAAEMIFQETKAIGLMQDIPDISFLIEKQQAQEKQLQNRLKSLKSECYDTCQSVKDEGNELFKTKCFNEASAKYEGGIELAASIIDKIGESASELSASTIEEIKSEVVAPLYSNACMCYQKLNDMEKALLYAEKACEFAPKWPKARYRKGQCLAALERHAEAAQAFWDGYQLNPKESGAGAMLKLFKTSVALGKRQAKAVEEQKQKDNGKSGSIPKTSQIFDFNVPVEIPAPGEPDKQLILRFNKGEAPPDVAGRFIRENNLDPSLVARIAHHVHTVMTGDD
mmetsp:Transcript_9695/g.11043  ORF Transcript_9695/g.11043 Transcript_9695/m.11043 type:complete len:561 (-) Transcript_9695:1334-3016(-)|eukprot:CAMPEP_0184028584 /NCGR_PEP_ID=MMETSP0954-20121128/14928_1 /TAXON_ID=627963 /ORGANISM="Aplanochytrium sp, Strain PBS07" /LENGTH=560 /DNA_ID=CAMNT_0026313457 /DNA_START=320 /DNA_END=2002 /DNA_ORIENTATION=-